MNKKKLLIVVNEAWFFNSHRLSLALSAKKNNYEVHVAAHGDKKSIIKIKNSGLIFHNIPFKRSSTNILTELPTLFSLVKLYKKTMPDIVHHVTIKPIVYGGIAAKITSVPHVVSAISGLGIIFIDKGFVSYIRKSIVKIIYKFLLMKKNNKIIFQNPDEQKMLINQKIVNEKSTYLIKGAGVNLDLFCPKIVSQKSTTVVLCARMIWDKGIQEFVNAAILLKKKEYKVNFLLVGAIDYDYPRYVPEEKLRHWNDEGTISWLGYQENIHEIYQNSSIVCLPSFYSEGIPKSLIEAAACGKPIVTTDMPGCREIVKDGFNGLLVPPKNDILLAKALEILIMNPELRLKYGKNGRLLVQEGFSQEKVNKMTLEVYEQFKVDDNIGKMN